MWAPSYLNHTDILDAPLELDAALMHQGTIGMKWHRRRYQNEDGSLTPLGRAHYGIGPARNSASKFIKGIKAAQKKSKQKKALAKARKVREQNKKIDEAKKKLVNEGTKEDLIKNYTDKKLKDREKLSYEELNAALDRLDKTDALNRRLNALAPTPKLDKFDAYGDKAKKFASAAQKYLDLYNTGAGIYNAVNMYRQTGKRLPKVNYANSQDRSYTDWQPQEEKKPEEKKKKDKK